MNVCVGVCVCLCVNGLALAYIFHCHFWMWTVVNRWEFVFSLSSFGNEIQAHQLLPQYMLQISSSLPQIMYAFQRILHNFSCFSFFFSGYPFFHMNEVRVCASDKIQYAYNIDFHNEITKQPTKGKKRDTIWK